MGPPWSRFSSKIFPQRALTGNCRSERFGPTECLHCGISCLFLHRCPLGASLIASLGSSYQTCQHMLAKTSSGISLDSSTCTCYRSLRVDSGRVPGCSRKSSNLQMLELGHHNRVVRRLNQLQHQFQRNLGLTLGRLC